MLDIFSNEKTLETTLFAVYSDFYNKTKIICDPGGDFQLNCEIIYETGDDVIITYTDKIVNSIKRGENMTFCGTIVKMILINPINDPMLPENYYYELHPKINEKNQISIPKNSRLLMPITMNKLINFKKPIMLRYRKGPCSNYYEVQYF